MCECLGGRIEGTVDINMCGDKLPGGQRLYMRRYWWVDEKAQNAQIDFNAGQGEVIHFREMKINS